MKCCLFGLGFSNGFVEYCNRFVFLYGIYFVYTKNCET